MHPIRLVPLLCAAAIQAAELLPGESLGEDLLGPSGLSAALAEQRSPFADDPGNGGSSRCEAGPDGPRLVLEDTAGGGASPNGAPSSLRWRIPAEAPVCARINAILARPVGEAPISMVFSCRMQRVAAASRLVWSSINLYPAGAKRFAGRLFVGRTDLRSMDFYRSGPALALDERNLPCFRFQVPATGGRSVIDGLELNLGLRVEGDSTPERIALDRIELHEIHGPPLRGDHGTLAAVGNAPPIALLAAARRAGWTVLPTVEDANGVQADLLLVQRRIEDAKAAAPVIAALDAGKAVLLTLADAGGIDQGLEDRLPANAWTWRTPNLQRADAGLAPSPDGAWSAVAAPLAVAHCFDLHLPGAPLENGMMRYQWQRYAKGPLVSDWRCELESTVAGRLPMLVTARSGTGRVAVFAADLADAQLAASPGFPACCDALLAWAKPQPAAAGAGGDPAALTLEVPPSQPDRLAVIVRNPGRSATEAVLSWKTSSWSREHLTARSVPVSVPAGGSVAVALADATPADAIPWRRIDAAILPTGRDQVLAHAIAAVAVGRPVELAVQTDPAEDPVAKDQARAPDEADWSDGRLAPRYLYSTAATPHLTVVARNGRSNLAPLATARDLGYPENPSINGINDLSWSLANVRGAGPWQGAWSGRMAAEQRVQLSWPMPVTVVGQRLDGYGKRRRWNESNPAQHQVLAADGSAILGPTTGAFTPRSGDIYAYCDEDFPAPATTSACTLLVTGLDPKADREPRNIDKTNCSLIEWEVLGWPGATPPPPASDELVVTATDLLSGAATELLRERITVAPGAEAARPVVLPAHPGFGPVRVAVRFAGATTAFDCIYTAPGTGIIAKGSLADGEQGLLCSRGWSDILPFGLGMRSQSEGWGGDDDKIWALTHNLMETGSRGRDAANRLFTTDTRFSHYTNPWRETPGGWYGWDLSAGLILERAIREKKDRFHVVGSDRWNGIPIGQTWGWSQYIRFDQYLRGQGGPGLSGRSRGAIAQEISEKYGNIWQTWQMGRYAGKLLATQEAFAKAGKVFSFESHGSFPLCGGTLGAALAKTHRSVGTDLFWELRNQDLYYALGTRFGLVAANPSLDSGAYGQWGWVNSDCNQWWFANNGGIDPARRQWYATYFAGRVTLDGRFAPYHVTGFSMQGGVGTQVFPDDMAACVRTAELTGRVRPEAAAGCILAISWAEQERHLGAKLGEQGVGLYASPGHEQIDQVFARAYDRLVKQGLPVGTVTAAESLAGWRGGQPLILADGFAWPEAQLAEVARLNRSGAPVLILGDAGEVQGEAAAGLCGVRRDGDGWAAAAGTERLELPGGPLFIRGGRSPVAWCPLPLRSLSAITAQAVVAAFLERIGDPLRLPPGAACTPLISQDRLWLPLCDQGDRPRRIAVAVKPGWFLPRLAGAVQAVDLEGGMRLPASYDAASGTLRFSVDLPGTGGRMILIDTVGR